MGQGRRTAGAALAVNAGCAFARFHLPARMHSHSQPRVTLTLLYCPHSFVVLPPPARVLYFRGELYPVETEVRLCDVLKTGEGVDV
jgi:hypothetical protein